MYQADNAELEETDSLDDESFDDMLEELPEDAEYLSRYGEDDYHRYHDQSSHYASNAMTPRSFPVEDENGKLKGKK